MHTFPGRRLPIDLNNEVTLQALPTHPMRIIGRTRLKRPPLHLMHTHKIHLSNISNNIQNHNRKIGYRSIMGGRVVQTYYQAGGLPLHHRRRLIILQQARSSILDKEVAIY